MTATPLRPFFTYFGGKWRIAKRYPAPEHQVLVEPFAGSAGYALRYPDRDVLLCDLNPVVAGTWEYLISTPEEEILALPLWDGTWSSVEELDISQQAKWVIGWWLNKGTTSPGKSPSAWVRNGEAGENYWGPGVRERLARQVQHIRHWKILNQTYLDLPNQTATWFVDPPYEIAGRYPVRAVDFAELATWSQSRMGQVMVCENAGAEWLPFRHFTDAKATHARYRTGVSKEVIWTGGITEAGWDLL